MLKRFILLALFVLGACSRSYSVPEQIMESVVLVNASSGVVVYSEQNKALVMTAYHVVAEDLEKAACSGCDLGVTVEYMYINYKSETPDVVFESYDAINIDFNTRTDLAIIEIHPGRSLVTAQVAKYNPPLGEQIWLGANPNFNYRSLKQGIISSTERVIGYKPYIEVSGGVIFGSSGGGAFDKTGKLFGVIHSIDMWESPFCYPVIDEEGNIVNFECVYTPLTDIGFVSQTFMLRNFLLTGTYKQYFEYLK